MAAPIPLMLKYSIVYNLLNFPLILIKFVSKFIACEVLYFKAQYLIRLRSLLKQISVLNDHAGFGGSVGCASHCRPGGRWFDPRQGRQHSFVEIDHEIFSMVIFSLPLIQEGQLSVSGKRICAILVNHLED